jgi:hypothetical protein
MKTPTLGCYRGLRRRSDGQGGFKGWTVALHFIWPINVLIMWHIGSE